MMVQICTPLPVIDWVEKKLVKTLNSNIKGGMEYFTESSSFLSIKGHLKISPYAVSLKRFKGLK